MELIQEALEKNQNEGIYPPNKGIYLALSGGPDSTALLLALAELIKQGRLKYKLYAGHVNHHLRPGESEADAAFCISLCASHKISLDIIDDPGSVQSSEQANQCQSEASLRNRRYALLAQAAERVHCSFILTAHTLDDQIETVFFRFLRGSALNGLKGMSLARSLTPKIVLFRPFLTINKDLCQNYLAASKISACYDSSNKNNQYARNYLRNLVLPLIRSRFTKVEKHIEQLRQIIATEDELLTILTKQAYQDICQKTAIGSNCQNNIWSLPHFVALPLALQRRILVLALKEREIEVSFERIENILQHTASMSHQAYRRGRLVTNLNGHWQVQVTSRSITWRTKNEPPSCRLTPQSIRIPGQALAIIYGRVLVIEDLREEVIAKATTTNNLPTNNLPKLSAYEVFVDLSKIEGPLTLRNPEREDYIQPFGMQERVHLKKYLHTHKTRAFPLPVVVLTSQQEVIWVPGVGISEKLRVANIPSHRMSWRPLVHDNADLV